MFLQRLVGKNICLCGDFNAVRNVEERRSRGASVQSFDCDPFNAFIENNFLMDLPLHGRGFTWYKGDGNSMSRIDRFLLSEEWCAKWPNCLQVASLRGLSDQFVRSKLQSYQVEGWGGFILKEKLKQIKSDLKEWHLSHSHNIPGKISSLKNQINVLDSKGEVDILSDEDMNTLHELSLELHSLSQVNASISWQQSRLLWLREGDANPKYYHAIMSGRRHRNAISSVVVNDNLIEGVDNAREAVFGHFQSHFQAPPINRPKVDDLPFRRLSIANSIFLTCPFREEEVKAAVWGKTSKRFSTHCFNWLFV